MNTIEIKSLNTPDEIRKFPKGQLELSTLAGVTFGKATFQPGWKWTEVMTPIAKTATCQAAHNNYIISGR